MVRLLFKLIFWQHAERRAALQPRVLCAALSCARRMPESSVFAEPLELGTLEPRAAAAAADSSDSISLSLCTCASALSGSGAGSGAQAQQCRSVAHAHFLRIPRFVHLKTQKIFWPRRGGRSQIYELGL